MCFSVPSSNVFSDRSRLRINRTNAENLSAGVDRTISQSDGVSYTVSCCTAQSSVQERSTRQQCKKSKTAAKRRRDAGRIKEFMERKQLAQMFPYFETTESEFRLLTSKNARSEQIGILEKKTFGLKQKVTELQKEISDRKNVQAAEKCIQTDTLNLDNLHSLRQKTEKLKSECLTVRKALHEERQRVKSKNIEISELRKKLKLQKTNSVQKPAATKQTYRTSTGSNNATRSTASSTLPQPAARERVYYAALAPPNFNNRLGLKLWDGDVSFSKAGGNYDSDLWYNSCHKTYLVLSS